MIWAPGTSLRIEVLILPANGSMGSQQHSAESLPKNSLWPKGKASPEGMALPGGSSNSMTD